MHKGLSPTSARWALLAAVWSCTFILGSAFAQPDELKAARPSPLEKLPSFEAQPTWTAPSDTPFVDITNAWPARVDRNGQRGVVREFPGPIQGWKSDRWFFQKVTIDEHDRQDVDAWLAAGGPVAGAEIELESVGSYVVEFGPNGRRFGTTAPMDEGLSGYRFVAAERAPGAAPGEPDRLLISRTTFVLYEPLGTGSVRSRAKPMPPESWKGFAVLMPGIFGTPDPVLDALTRHLRLKGYWVLRMLAQSSRFTEHLEIEVDPDDGYDEPARRTAHALCGRAADCAYAVQAVAAQVLSTHPEMRKLPRVILGASGGGLTLPTVVALEPAQYRAAIIIAGGCDFWLINQRSNYSRGVGAIVVKWRRPPTDEEVRRFDRAYLAQGPLDSFNTAGALRRMPVLMHYGSVDLAVQSTLADLLWERLGRPDRTVVQLGHEWLFASLGGRFTEMTDWLDRSIGVGERTPANAIAGSTSGGEVPR